MSDKAPYRMEFDMSTIKHLGLQMYSTLPPVLAELVANAWDANATKVNITIPETSIEDGRSEIVVKDNGVGMSDRDIREKYIIIGRDRREKERSDETLPPFQRKVMGRKGIGKFSAFGIAREIEVESAHEGNVNRFVMNYDQILKQADRRHIHFPALSATGNVSEGTTIKLRSITKYKNRRIAKQLLRRGLARRFAVIGTKSRFEVVVNGEPITLEERDLQRLLDKDEDDNLYIWTYEKREIEPNSGWFVSGWIGALDRTTSNIDGIDRGISIMARGKLVQEPFLFHAVVGQQYALSYIIGELVAEFVDEVEDTIGTSRNTLVWDTDANSKLMQWGKEQINKIAREWAEKRSADNRRVLERNELYMDFRNKAKQTGNSRAFELADQLVRQSITKSPIAGEREIIPIIQMSLDFIEFDSFVQIAGDLVKANINDIPTIFNLFKEWQIVEAKEMSRVAEGRITTIQKLQDLIQTNALEVPTLHNFLKEFPWVIDPRWTLVDDEITYSDILRTRFPEADDLPDPDRRIDFLCVRESTDLVVVEIKRPGSRASEKDLSQIEEYVSFMRDRLEQSTDPDLRFHRVVGYLLCGDLVNTWKVRQRKRNLESSQIYVRKYDELLDMVTRMHREFIKRYDELKSRNANEK